MKSDASFAETAAFHGHVCPGLAIGYRMTKGAMDRFARERAIDEELVAVVENDACGVDAVQYLSGCTFGKGNLLFRDYGKQVYTFFQRSSGRAVRVSAVANREAPEDRQQRLEWMLEAPEAQVVKVEEISLAVPEYARIRRSASCSFCGERTMETRLRVRDGQLCCIPCAEAEARDG